jgi:DNA-binding NtrC family response regulator
LGGKEPINVDVRIIAATNRDLEAAVANGTFREDLYYRLRVVTITMPPLRERKEDVDALAYYLLTRLSAEMSVNNPGIGTEALQKIKGYDWPGNIRELLNTIKKALIFNRGAPLQAEDITLLREEPVLQQSEVDSVGNGGVRLLIRSLLNSGEKDRLFDSCIDNVATLIIREALLITQGNRSRAAKLLGISRPTLHAKIEKYDLGRAAENSE